MHALPGPDDLRQGAGPRRRQRHRARSHQAGCSDAPAFPGDKGLANRDAAAIVAAREDRPYVSIDDLWRRAGVPVAAFTQLAEADAFGLARREALWAIRPLRDEPLPLFAAAAKREAQVLPEAIEPAVTLRPMTGGREVVEDYSHIGLSLRAHPISFLRADLARRRIVPCAEAMAARDRSWLETTGLILVRQRLDSAKGVLFATIEDETSIANVVVWTKTFEKYRRVVLSSAMLGIRGRIQREGDVVHLVAHHLTDLSALLKTVGHREGAFPLRTGTATSFITAARAPIRASARRCRRSAISGTLTATSTKSG